jgi:soluble lytic murein transglycosylase
MVHCRARAHRRIVQSNYGGIGLIDGNSSAWKTFATLLLLAATATAAAQTTPSKKKHAATTHTATTHAPAASHRAGRKPTHGRSTRGAPASAHAARTTAKGRHGHASQQAPETAESRRLHAAFVASSSLRPMAQQLVLTRSSAAYAGVSAYAGAHPGDAGSAAELALGHAYMLDRRFPEAEAAFQKAGLHDAALADYADYLGAQAAVNANRPAEAAPLLEHFADRHPGSLFLPSAPVLLAKAYLVANNPQDALKVLAPLETQLNASPSIEAIPVHAPTNLDLRLTLAKAYQAAGNAGKAAPLYRGIYLGAPVSSEAATAQQQLQAMNVPLTPAERKEHADALFDAKQYGEAANEYHSLERSDAGLNQADKDALQIYAAVCDLRLKRLGRGDVERLPVTNDDTAALRLYLQAELERSDNNPAGQDDLVRQLLDRYPSSRWTEEALYSAGNNHLIHHDAQQAADDFSALVQHFPHSVYAPGGHWKAAWMNYRLHRWPDAARLMDEQITTFPGSAEIPGALYWRGRLFEDIEHNAPQALNYYKALNATYVNTYYAMLARQRIAAIGQVTATDPAPALAAVHSLDNYNLIDSLPDNDIHLIKARLLANAALNEYIRPEIMLSPTANEWGALAEAEIYQSFGETTRALQAMKRSGIPFLSLPVTDVPQAYWHILFPEPYWGALTADAQASGLDPYLVASLIRQESEFNAGVVSRANAYGLMQLLPSTGKSIAKKNGERHFATNELLDPTENLKLGTIDLRRSIDHWDGQVEYALAAYNAGDTPVKAWIAQGGYRDIPEWVESIPYTETREYVQAIVRNRELYRAVYGGKQ